MQTFTNLLRQRNIDPQKFFDAIPDVCMINLQKRITLARTDEDGNSIIDVYNITKNKEA